MSHTKTSIEQFLAECERALGFLKQEHGFTGPEVDAAGLSASVMYTRGNIAIQVSWDRRDGWVGLYGVRLREGRIPRGFAVDEDGRLIRTFIWDLARVQEKPPPVPERPGRRKRPKAPPDELTDIRAQLQSQAALLREYGGALLEGSDAAFDEIERREALRAREGRVLD